MESVREAFRVGFTVALPLINAGSPARRTLILILSQLILIMVYGKIVSALRFLLFNLLTTIFMI
jgi:hypothetical protein